MSAFPADRARLLAEAEEQQATAAVLAALRTLPDGESYETVGEVWAALVGEDDPREPPRPTR